MSLQLKNNQGMTVELHRHIQCVQLESILSWRAGWWILWNMHNLLYCPWNQAGDPWWKDTNERSHCSRPRVFGVLSNKTLPLSMSQVWHMPVGQEHNQGSGWHGNICIPPSCFEISFQPVIKSVAPCILMLPLCIVIPTVLGCLYLQWCSTWSISLVYTYTQSLQVAPVTLLFSYNNDGWHWSCLGADWFSCPWRLSSTGKSSVFSHLQNCTYYMLASKAKGHSDCRQAWVVSHNWAY